MGIIFVVVQLDTNTIVELLIATGTIWLIVLATLLFVGMMCASIQVRELFVDVSRESLGALEQQVCGLMTTSDKFITNDVGQPGQDNPVVLANAQAAARGKAPVPVCQLSPTELEDRISRMENALTNFTGPQIQKTYDLTVPCTEGFVGSFADRLQAIKETVDRQNGILVPIQKKEADVKAGILSECEKNKGAKKAVGA